MARAWNAREGPTRILHPFVAMLMMTALLAVMPMGTALAAHLDTTFEIDGNRTVEGGPPATDWANHPTVETFGDLCERLDGNLANGDDIIEPSTKLNGFDWPLVEQKATKKGDLCLIQTAWEIDTHGDLIFFLGWERSDAEGEVTIYVPLDDGDGVADPGDVLLRYDYDSTSKSISIFEHLRTGGGWGTGTPIVDEEFADAAVSGSQLFAETAINLSALSLFSGQGCQAYYSAAVITETGQADANATLKDYVDVDISFSNCGALRVVKHAEGGDATFAFTSETIEDFDITTSNGNGSKSIGLLEPGTYDVSEVVPVGWRLDGVTCSGGMAAEELTISANETVACAFTNVRDASITIEKRTVGADGEFDFTSSLGDFTLADDDTEAFTGLDAGTFVFAEDAVAGWELGSISCEYGSSTVDMAILDRKVTIGLAAGDDVHCTFENVAPGSITVWKLTDGDVDAFPFTFDGTDFDLVTDAGVASRTFDLLQADTYDITEAVPEAWELSEVTCSDVEVWTQITDGVQVDLQPGEDAHCYFTDTLRALPHITVVKDTGAFETSELFPMELSEGAAVVASADLPTGGSTTWIVQPGDYELIELVPDHWLLDTISCDRTGLDRVEDGDEMVGVAFSLVYKDELTCTFTNLPYPTVTVIKDTAGFETERLFPIELRDWESLVHTAYLGSGGEHTWTVDPYSWYSLDELVPVGWELTDLECTGIGTPMVGSEHHVAFAVDPGDDVECTFTNKPLPTITVEKEANASGTFDFVLDKGPAESVAVGGSHRWTVEPGDHTLVEELPNSLGWEFLGVTCVGADAWTETDGLVDLAVEYGDDVVCTFTNDYTAPLDLLIEKTGVVPADTVDDGVSPVEWTLVVSHDTDSLGDAVGATVTDPAPAGMTFATVSSDDTTCVIVDNAVSCGPFDLALGETLTVEVDATVTVGGFYENTGTVTVDGDIDLSNNVDSYEVLVPEVLGIEILPETGADVVPVASLAALLLLLGALLVRVVDVRSDSRF